VVGQCGYGNELSGSLKGGKFHVPLSDCSFSRTLLRGGRWLVHLRALLF